MYQQAIALDGLYYQEMEINECDAKVTKLSDWTLPRFRQLIERCVRHLRWLCPRQRPERNPPPLSHTHQLPFRRAVPHHHRHGRRARPSPTEDRRGALREL